MLDILNIIPGKKRSSVSGWWSFNGICCHHRGHKPDRRGRAGVLFTDSPDFIFHCFNCNFKTGWRRGSIITKNMRLLLSWCGLSKSEIDALSLASLKIAPSESNPLMNVKEIPQFEYRELPPKSRPIRPETDHGPVQYLASRGLTVDDYPFLIVDGETRPRIIIPYYWHGKIVGYTSRYYDDHKPKYISEQQRGYVFNMDNINPKAKVVILVEGQFDAISIGGCAYMSSSISDSQARLLEIVDKEIIVVPDQDSSGLEICDSVLDRGWSVSIPPWPPTVKDVNDAVKNWGRLATTMSILEYRTKSRIKMEMTRRKLT